MTSGGMDSQSLKNVSSKLLLKVSSRGRLPTLNLSAYASQVLADHSAAQIGCLDKLYRCQKKLSSEEQKQAQKRAQAYSTYSMMDLAKLDKLGIKVLCPDMAQDEFDRSWAE